MKLRILTLGLLSVFSGSICAGDLSQKESASSNQVGRSSKAHLFCVKPNREFVARDGCKLRLTQALLQTVYHYGSPEDKLKFFKKITGLDEACVKEMKYWDSGVLDVLHLPTNEKGVTCSTLNNGVDFVLSGLGNFGDVTHFVEQRAAGVIALMLERYMKELNAQKSKN